MRDHKETQQTNQILESLFKKFGFSKLTEIQKQASPLILQKKDCLVIAPTGSGKTECSVIPIFSILKKSKKQGKIKALYITPLRALNRDVFRRITKYAQENELSIEIRHGDTTQKDRKKINENPPDILITTPETLVILLTQIKMLDALYDLEWIIIDEVHELLSSERGAQLSLSIERLEFNSKYPLTKIGLSATVGNFEEAGKFVVGTKRKCEIIRDTSVRKYDVEIKYVEGTISDVAEKITEYVLELKLDSPVLLFTNTRGEAEFLASILKDKSSIPIELHHGSLSKEVREETESTLREGKRGIVVCTSSLELGLDIGSIELVIHYGSPRQVSKFVQRIGRSRHNRDASARGLIITNNSDDEFEAQAILDRIQEGSIEEQKIHNGSLDVLAHHLVGFAMQSGEISVEQAFDLVTKAYPFRNLQVKDLIDVLDLLDSNYLIFFDRTKMTFWKKGRSFKYYFENLSTIPDILKFKVFDSVGKKIIGSLDQRFVGDFGDSGNIFVLKGSQWRILNIDEKSFTVNVEPFRGSGITVPYWEGESIPIDYKTARKVGQFRSKVKNGSLVLKNKLIEKLNFDVIPDENNVVIESNRSQGSIVIHSCFGTRINSTLSVLLSSFLSSLLGSIVDSRSDGYRIVLSSRSRISEKLFIEVLKDDYDLHSIISASLTGTHNVNWRTWCVAKKFGIVGRGAIYERKSARFLYERYSKTALVREALRELFHDKYDLKNSDNILKKIREDEIHIKWLEVDQFSKLAEPILDHTTKYYSSPANLDKGILDLVKARLQKTKHRLICARCGKWERLVETHEVKNILICPYCKGRQITATYHSDYDLPKIIRKKHEGKKLSSDEKHKFDRAWKVSSLVENFGKIAITVMSGYGVGADTAARILRNMVDEEHLFKQIYEAERQYVVTRGFWDS
ncbi:DEAD/DEAH box helicase [Nitrosopumilus ureiphilus]|uniref:Lhr helicase n=1 Tax=Nitrosopumilus ureiphilus TaxID=1470067 RepID=A0A7D5RA41_9ARCH|nr:DEAD/DEAH box helicase [Nitrosopumilus ureiphilus]QLH05722.1 Lhr helicase [Nitrosopumilus ureiphilus]